MATKLEPYFGRLDLTQFTGDSFNGTGLSLTYEIDGVNFSFTDWTVSAKLYDRFGNELLDFDVSKSTEAVTDDTLLIEASSSAMPSAEGLYKYTVTATKTATPTEVFTIVVGTVSIVKKTDF